MTERPVSRTLAVILHADVAGSTALVQRDEALAHTRLTDAFRRLASTIEQYGGTVHEIRGDALVAEFARASDAAAAALAFQKANRAHNARLDDPVAPVLRMGVSLGEVVIADATVTGPGVVLAQRLEQLAQPGGLCIQQAVYEALPRHLPFDYDALGEQQLKGFDEPVRAYSVKVRNGAELPAPSSPPRARRRARLLLIAGVAASVAIVLGVVVWTLTSEENAASLLTNKPSIAVLPFENLSNDPEQEYFSDGITSDIITDLSKFRSLLVVASSSVFAYKGKRAKAQELSAELGVRYLVEGSVQRTDGTLRVNAQLVDATTGHHLWAERYERDLKDLFLVQEEIVQTIVRTLAVKVDKVERRRAMGKATGSLEAYDYLLRGREYLSRRTLATNIEARQMFQRAIELDPGYAAAYVELGRTYRLAFSHGWTEFPGDALQKAHDLAQKALSLEESAAAHRLLGAVHLSREQYDLAVHALERAMALNPNDWDSQALLGVVMLYTGRSGEASQALATALRFNPGIDVDRFFHLGLAYYLKSRYHDAIRTLEQGLGRNPEHLFLHIALAAAYAQAGRPEDAARASATVLRLHPFFEVEAFGTRFTKPDDRASIAQGLRKAGLK